MARLGRKGRILKRVGMVSLLFTIYGLLASAFYVIRLGNPVWEVLLVNGRLHISYEQHPLPPDSFSGDGEDYESLPPSLSVYPSEGSIKDWYWLPGDPKYDREWLRQSWEVQMPLWIPILLVALPTAFLWWRDWRRIPPGHCQKCGYNLTGNVSGVCPDCGEKVTPQQPA